MVERLFEVLEKSLNFTGVAGETETDQEDTKPSVADLDKEGKGLLTTGATKKKKHKKRVSWKDDSEIKQIFYFELDEDERGRDFYHSFGNAVP